MPLSDISYEKVSNLVANPVGGQLRLLALRVPVSIQRPESFHSQRIDLSS